ncbi:MAG: hypothetical protein HC869_21540 [Rhodospirillales bacterium]|nr:hypothetical protein [Rhodospirillales bacterium]
MAKIRVTGASDRFKHTRTGVPKRSRALVRASAAWGIAVMQRMMHELV